MAKRLSARGKKIPGYWSVSAYNNWRDCAYKYMLEKVHKFRGPPSKAMERGNRIHKLFEHLLLGNVTGMPDELNPLAKEIRNLCMHGGSPEEPWTLTKDLQHTHPKDWSGAWLRAKLDAHVYWEDEGELLIIDLKTGRFNIAQSQMDLYAAMAQFYYPDVKTIRVELWFVDQGEIHGQDYTPKEAKDLWRKWLKRSDAMLKDRKFLPSPGPACQKYGGCAMRSDRKLEDGRPGPCHEWKKAKKTTG